MENLPEHIISKLMQYSSYPLAEHLRATTMFQYMNLLEENQEEEEAEELRLALSIRTGLHACLFP